VKRAFEINKQLKEINYLINQKGYRWINQWSLKKP
jgi:hypothetical protein